MCERREAILEGNNPIPVDLMKGMPEFDLIKQFCNALWNNYIKNPNYLTAIPYWYDKFQNEMNFRKALIALGKGGWINSTCSYAASWGQVQLNEDKLLEYCEKEELNHVRAKFKYSKYALEFKDSIYTNVTKLGNEFTDTGLERVGFAMAGNTQFGFDTRYLTKYKEAICMNFTKGMDKVREYYPEMPSDEASYDSVSVGVLDLYESNPEELYTTGENVSDSRGRAISSSLRKIGNPIGYKDMRALLVVPY